MAKQDKIQGTVRLGGRTFTAGQEKELQAAADAMGVDVQRAYGVDSTEVKPGNKGRNGPAARAAALALEKRQAKQKEAKEKETGRQRQQELEEQALETTVADLPALVEQMTEIGQIKKLMRKDGRVSAKPVYEARIEAIKAEEAAAESAEGDVEGAEGEVVEDPDAATEGQ